MDANVNMLYSELKRLNKTVEMNNALLLSVIPTEKVSAKELGRLKKIKAEMDSGKAVPYSKSLF